jgi:hypothetical protein
VIFSDSAMLSFARLLVELLVGPDGMQRAHLGREAVVIAHEQGLDGGQLDVLVDPPVAGHEQLVGGNLLSIVGDAVLVGGDGGQLLGGEIAGVVFGQQVAGAAFQQAAEVSAEGAGHAVGRAINLR